MTYDFKALSPADFEDLTRDLLGQELKLRFEAFCAGPDGGMDGRHSKNGKKTVLQAKHYAGSTFAQLKAAMVRERISIDKLDANRYLLATSCNLSPANKTDLATLIGPALQEEADVFGPGDLNALLTKFPEIEKAHIKLWMSSSAVLDRVLNAAAHTFAALAREEIEAKVRVYAPNPRAESAQVVSRVRISAGS